MPKVIIKGVRKHKVGGKLKRIKKHPTKKHPKKKR